MKALERIQTYLERLYETTIQDNDDRIILVIGDEGAGKSTFILQAIWLYEQIRGYDPSPASVLDAVVFDDREVFRQKLLNADKGDPIAAMDAAHLLYKKEAMNPDQIDTEKQLLDIRIGNHPIFLGYQDWNDVPDILQRRRAENAFYIPQRGYVNGFSRAALDEKYNEMDAKEWPDPSLRDTFPSLEGTALWERFEEIDEERKRARLQVEEEEDGVTPQEVVDEIIASETLENFVDINEFQDRAYYSKPYIRFEYPELSDQEADQVRSALRRHAEPAELAGGEEDAETETQPPRGTS